MKPHAGSETRVLWYDGSWTGYFQIHIRENLSGAWSKYERNRAGIMPYPLHGLVQQTIAAGWRAPVMLYCHWACSLPSWSYWLWHYTMPLLLSHQTRAGLMRLFFLPIPGTSFTVNQTTPRLMTHLATCWAVVFGKETIDLFYLFVYDLTDHFIFWQKASQRLIALMAMEWRDHSGV